MGLGQKILVFTGLIVVTLVAVTLGWTAFESSRLARSTIEERLTDTRDVWQTLQADRYQKLKLGLRVLSNDPGFRALLEEEDAGPTISNSLQERGKDLGSPLMIYTDWDGFSVARSDRLDGDGQDLSQEPVVAEALEGEEPETIWEREGQFFHTVSVPMMTSEIIGVLVAGFRIDEALANQIRKLTGSEVAFLVQHAGQAPRIAVSSLGPAQQEALGHLLEVEGLPAVDGVSFPLGLPGDASVGILVPLTALSGERVGSVLALRSLALETAGFRRFRNNMILVSVVVMALALFVGHAGVSRITGPVRRLVALVESARDGSYTGAVAVGTDDEIGVLASAFNGLLTDLREKEQMLDFLRGEQAAPHSAATAALPTADTAPSTSGIRASGTTPNALRLTPGQLLANRYRIISTLGKGGMGIVYRAHDQKLDEDVALKLLRPEVIERDPTLLARFKLELKLARRVTHRNILRTFDFEEADGVPYISMEYVEGVMLKDLIESRGALPAAVGFRVAKQICLGLEAAHAEGVVHRDIKPHNMMIVPETGAVKIMDFGIARVSEVKGGEGGLTTDGTVMGTPDYMPPEQAQGHAADFRSDVYSLGVVLFEMFTGQLPFRAENAMAVILAHIREPPPSPSSLQPGLAPRIEAIILRCLAKQPEQRFATVAELRKQLTAASSAAEAAAA